MVANRQRKGCSSLKPVKTRKHLRPGLMRILSCPSSQQSVLLVLAKEKVSSFIPSWNKGQCSLGISCLYTYSVVFTSVAVWGWKTKTDPVLYNSACFSYMLLTFDVHLPRFILLKQKRPWYIEKCAFWKLQRKEFTRFSSETIVDSKLNTTFYLQMGWLSANKRKLLRNSAVAT